MDFSLESVSLAEMGMGADATDVLTAQTQDVIPNILSTTTSNLSLANKDDIADKLKAEEEAKKAKEEAAKTTTPVATDNTLTLAKIAEGNELSPEETEAAIKNAGRPRTDKDALNEYLKTKIEAGDFFTYDDFDEKKQTLEEYITKLPEKERYELLDMNIQKKAKEGLETAPKEFFESLPDKLQYAAAYVAEGGQDLETLFLSLAKAEQMQKLDAANEDHQIPILRNYLQLTTKLTPNQVEEQISEWQEAGKVEKKAKEFKPTLDTMHEEQAAYQVQQAAIQNKQRQEAANMFVQNIGKVLQKGEVGGMTLGKKQVNELYYDITQANYPSISGKPTNIIGHMMEKIQYVEPDYDHLTELAWYLRDREGFKNAIKQQGKNEKVEEVSKKLKDAQYIKTTMITPEPKEETTIRKIGKPLNILSR